MTNKRVTKQFQDMEVNESKNVAIKPNYFSIIFSSSLVAGIVLLFWPTTSTK